MKDHPNNQEAHKASPEEIAECISGKLGVDINQDSYRELIAQIEEILEIYSDLESGKGGPFPYSEHIEGFDNAISSLEGLTLWYIALPEYNLLELHEKHIRGEKPEMVIGDSDGEKERGRDIRAVKRRIRDMKDEVLSFIDSISPSAIIVRNDPNGWLALNLFNSLRSAFHGHTLHNTKIDGTTYLLSRLYGIQEEESKNPEAMMRERRRRFFEKIEPHLSQPQ